jgi:hypothetical protein
MFTVTGISALRSILWIPKKVFIRLLYSTLLCLTELLSWPEPLGETIKDIVLGFCIMWCIQPTEQINHVMHTTYWYRKGMLVCYCIHSFMFSVPNLQHLE